MSIRALIFDFDGLILDTESTEYQSWQELFTDHGCQLSLNLWIDTTCYEEYAVELIDSVKLKNRSSVRISIMMPHRGTIV